jgi:hypothetical protein
LIAWAIGRRISNIDPRLARVMEAVGMIIGLPKQVAWEFPLGNRMWSSDL